jgi:hypothetical protein
MSGINIKSCKKNIKMGAFPSAARYQGSETLKARHQIAARKLFSGGNLALNVERGGALARPCVGGSEQE